MYYRSHIANLEPNIILQIRLLMQFILQKSRSIKFTVIHFCHITLCHKHLNKFNYLARIMNFILEVT